MPPHLLGTIIKNCDSYGIRADATVDLSGLHHYGQSSGDGDLGGFNEIFGSLSAQIVTTNSAANVWVFRDDIASPPCTWSTVYAGLNDIYQPNAYWSSLLITGMYSGAPGNNSLDIGNNFWEIGSTPLDPQYSYAPFYWPYFNFSASVSAVSQQAIPGALSCGSALTHKGKGEQPLSMLSNTDSCGNAFGAVFLWEQNQEYYDSMYDTMQWYIRHCYPLANAAQTWGAYNDSWSAVLNTPGGRDSIFNFVLYGLGLRNDDEWFCLGVPLLQVKFVSRNGTMDFAADRAIDRFLMDNPRCAWNYDADSTDYSNLLRVQWNYWADTSQPGEVFDSTIPTLHDLGLDTLLKLNAEAGVPFALPTPPILLDARVTDNPFPSTTSVWLSIGREAYVRIEVFDVLGREIAGAGYEGTFEQGTKEVPLDLTKAPPGAYYVRVSTANNEVRTIKITKQ